MNLWSCFEALSGLSAVPAVWRARLGADFAPFRNTFLEAKPRTVLSFPCPRHCGCAHRVVTHTDGTIVGVCQCKPRVCDNLELIVPDITPLELNWPKFCRAISKAFGLASRFEPFSGRYTAQIGSWSADPVPVILTIQCDQTEFRLVVASLVARFHRSFILLAPTSSFMDAASLGYLANIGAEFFPLESNLILTDHGTFQPKTAPGEIFVRFRPEPKEPPDEDVARKAFAIIVQLDPESRRKPPSVLRVLRLYCMKEMSVAQIACRCHCSKTTIVDRLNVIFATTGVRPRDLRRLSVHFESINTDLMDSRAERIYRKGATSGDNDE